MADPILLDGKLQAKLINESLKLRVEKIIESTGRVPILATILVGADPGSVMYVKMKGNACKRAGIQSKKVELSGSVSTEDVLKVIQDLNEDPDVHGILLQHPVPDQVDEPKCFNAILPAKDVDGVNYITFAQTAMNKMHFGSATPLGIITLLKKYNIQMEGKNAVVVGRSAILGKPLSMMLLNENATVTICHSRTKNLPEIIKTADIVVGAVGKPEFIKADWVKDGVVLVDAGYNPGNLGDTEIDKIKEKALAYTPIPGGVGPMTIITLIEQTVRSAELKLLK